MGPVLLLDDDADLLESLADLLRYMSRQCVVARSVAELTAARAEVLACEVALLDINLGKGQPSGIDAYRWLRDQQFAGRIAFLTGHGQSHPLVAQAHRLGTTTILSKPFTLQELQAVLEP